MPEIRTLTGLRGIAAIWVISLHYTMGWKEGGFALKVAEHGGAGLTVFFVLSGFIMAYVYGDSLSGSLTWSKYKSFLWARFSRVYPLHIAILTLWVICIPLKVTILDVGDSGFTLALNALLLQAWGFVNVVTWNQPAWSISAEVFCYLLFPLLIPLVRRLNSLRMIGMLIVLWWLVNDIPYGYLLCWLQSRNFIGPEPVRFFYGGSLSLWLPIFLTGTVAFELSSRVKHSLRLWMIYDVMFLFGMICFMYLCSLEGEPRSFYVLASVVVIVGLSRDSGLGRLLLGNSVVVFFGNISFALYLSHVLVALSSRHLSGYIDVYLEAGLTIFASTALHYGFERPVRTWFRRMGTRVRGPQVSILPSASSGGAIQAA